MFMFWEDDSFPYYNGAKVASGPDEQGRYKRESLSSLSDISPGVKPLYLCSDAEGWTLMQRRKSMREEFEVLQNNLYALCKECQRTLPPELRT